MKDKEKVLVLESNREGYTIKQCGKSITVAELISILENYNEDMKVYISNDRGYTYGSISEEDFRREYIEEE